MKKTTKRSATAQDRHQERGAALIMMLLISMLLLAAGGALIVSTALSTTSVYEATPEMQAYYAAEAGLEDVLTVLRGNVAPLDTAAAPAAPASSVVASVSAFASSAYSAFMPTASAAPQSTTAPGGDIPDSQKISLRRAVDSAYADHPDDPANAPNLRLSRWLEYNYTPPDGDYADRVALTDNYSPLSGTAYRVALSDPDDSTTVGATTTGLFKGVPGATVSGDGLSLFVQNIDPDLNTVIGTATVTYVPRTAPAPTSSYPSLTTTLGSFNVTSTGIGASIPPGVRFQLSINQTAPWEASGSLNASLQGNIDPSLGATFLRVNFLKDAIRLDGTLFTLPSKLLNLTLPPASGSTPVQANITAPDPKRVLVRSTGFGPKGARKILEMLVTRSNLDFEPPATLTFRGANDCSGPTFSAGSSNAKEYVGADLNGADPPRPAFAVTACDYDNVVAGTSKPETVSGPPQIGILDNGAAVGTMSSEPVETPGFLQNADKARQYLNELEATARTQGRYFKPTSGSAMTVNSGTATNPVFTFVDGDCTLDGGAGMLVVTGNLEMSGNPSFDGIILVLGGGSVNRNGGGNGNINGSMVISKFDRTWPAADDDPAIVNHIEYPFLFPTFTTSGGGNSTMQYSSTAVSRALNIIGGPRVAGVAEL